VKHSLTFVAALVGLAGGFAGAQTQEARSSQAQGPGLEQNWGPTVKGIRAGLSTDKTSYLVGEDVALYVVLENVSAADPIYGEPFRPQPAFDYNFFSSAKITVQDEDGPLLPSRAIAIGDLAMSGGPLSCPAPYPLGEPMRTEKSLRRVRLLPREPGTYKITVTWSPYAKDVPSCEPYLNLNGAAVTPPPKPSVYVSVTSNPVFIQIVGESSSPNELEYTAWRQSFSLADTSFGENTALLDKVTNLEWLRLNFTTFRSYGQVVKGLEPGGDFEGWRVATVDELRTFFAHFTGTADGHSENLAIERKLQRLLGGPLNEVSNPSTGWHRSDTSGWVGSPIGPDNNMVHYHMAYIGEDSGPMVTIDPDSAGSAAPGAAPGFIGTFLVRQR